MEIEGRERRGDVAGFDEYAPLSGVLLLRIDSDFHRLQCGNDFLVRSGEFGLRGGHFLPLL
ncbi:hypothetical protein [Streptomyces filamentosus]